MQASQRTGRVTWATSRRSASAPRSTTLPSALDSSGRVGSAGRDGRGVRAQRLLGGRHEAGVERARRRPAASRGPGPAVCSASRGQRGQRARGDDLRPRRCGWRDRARARSSRASTSSGFPPSTALMPVGSSAHAAAISRPRTAASATAASGVEHAGDRGGGQLTDGVARATGAPGGTVEPAPRPAARWPPRAAGSPRCP